MLDPLNAVGDREGAQWQDDGSVVTPPGFKDAYRQFCELGWNGLAKDLEFGGQGMPQLVAAAVDEMWNASNMAFELCPMLTGGAIEAIERNGSDSLKRTYLPKMVSGEWTGTMNLTEPQAGSDLAAMRTKAVLQADGTYLIDGTKIFITYGEHDYTDNIIHLVLARTPEAPPGVKGISLFVVPKFLVNADGSLGARNDVRCVSLEHKLGIHASPTAVLAFGDHGGAIGYLVGEENRGLEYMFVMMNEARFGVGMQGVASPIAPTSARVAYARDRVQGRVVGAAKDAATGHHRSSRRAAHADDDAGQHRGGARARLRHGRGVRSRAPPSRCRGARRAARVCRADDADRQRLEHRSARKQMASLGVQVHGGMGFIEETGAAQYVRDARITTIYEGTTGIQANDLIGRKIARDSGQALGEAIATMRGTEPALAASGREDLAAIGTRLRAGLDALEEAGRFVTTRYVRIRARCSPARCRSSSWRASSAAVRNSRAQRASPRGNSLPATAMPHFLRAKIATARHFADHCLTHAPALRDTIVAGADGSARARR